MSKMAEREHLQSEERPSDARLPRREFLKGAAILAGGVALRNLAAPLAKVIGAPGPPASAPSGQLTVAQSFSSRRLSPHFAGGPQEEINIAEQMCEKLIEWSPDATSFEPRLAASWRQVDSLTLQLMLRQGVRFTNGEAFNAESAKYSLETTRRSPGYAGFVEMIDRIDIIDQNTLNIKTKFPTLLHLQSLAWSSYQYPPSYFSRVGAEEFGKQPIGTGPFKVVEWVRDSHVKLEANENYWAGAPAVKTLVFRTIPEGSARIAALEAGEIDFAINIPLDAVVRLQRNQNLQVFSRPSLRLFSLTFSVLRDTPLRNPRVRQALRHAIDVKALIRLLRGYGVPLNGQLLAPGYFGYDPQRKPIPFNPERAKRMLEEAGHGGGFELTFKYPSGRYVQDKEIGQVIAAQLGKVGVRVRQEVLEGGTFITQLQQQELNDMFLSGSLPPPDAHFMFLTKRSGTLYVYWSDPKFDSLYDRAASTGNRDERVRLYKDILDLFDQNPPDVPLYQPIEFYAASKRVSGFTPRAMQFLDARTWRLA